MNKITIRNCLFVLIAGMFLVVVSGCGYRCEGWAYRTAYRQMCKSYSSNGHCSFWGSESYQERYCTRWIKDPGSKKRSRSKTPPLRLALKAGKAYFPKIPGAPTDGETYLLTQLTPFLCEIMKSDDIIKTLSSMGQCKIQNKKSKHWDFQYDYITKSYSGNHGFTVGDHPVKWLYIEQTKKNPWPFSREELTDWMSSFGLDVFQYGSNYFYGVAGHTGGESIDIKNINNYPFYFRTNIFYQRDEFGTNYQAPQIVGRDFGLYWKNQSKAKAVFCKKRANKWYQKSFDAYRNKAKKK